MSNDYTGYCVFAEDVGTVWFQNKDIAQDLFNKLEGFKRIYESDSKGNLTLLSEVNK